MKCIAFIMAFIILVLNVMPCADTEPTFNDENSFISGHKVPQEQEHDDECSPFCSCACCPGVAFYYTLPPQHSVPVFTNNTSGKFISSEPVGFVFSFWQPPRNC